VRLWSRVVLRRPPVLEPLKSSQFFYGTRKFITVFTKVRHWSLYWARRIHSIPLHYVSVWSILIHSSHLVAFFFWPSNQNSVGSPIPCVLHPLPLCSSLTWSFWLCMEKSASSSLLNFPCLLLFQPSTVQIFSGSPQHPVTKHHQSVLFS
jgi:hypothetical protein